MQNLPVAFRKYFPQGLTGSNVSLSYWFQPKDEKLLEERGCAGLFVTLSGPADISGERMAKFMWDSFQENYFYTGMGAISDLLKTSVKSAHHRLVELMQNQQSVSEQGVDMHLCAFIIHDGQGYFCAMGNPGIALFREGEMVNIREMLPAYGGVGYKEQISVGKFGLSERDIFLITTPELVTSFVDIFGKEELKEVVSGWDRFSDELSLFSDNLTGNQYIWLFGYGIEDVPEEKPAELAVEQKVEDSKGISKAEGDETVSENTEKTQGSMPQETSSQGASYTPGGIKGLLSKAKGAVPSFKIRDVPGKLKERVSSFDFGAFKRKISAKITEIKLRGGRPRKLFVKPALEAPKLTKKTTIGLALLVFVVLALVFSWFSFQRRKGIELIDTRLATVQSDIEAARSVWTAERNRMVVESAINDANAELSSIAGERLQPEQQTKIDEITALIQGLIDTMNLVTPLSEDSGNVEILMDAYLKIGESADIQDITLAGDYIYIVDKGSHAVYRYVPGADAVEKLANSQEVMKEPLYIDAGDNYLFVYDAKVGVLSLDMTRGEGEWAFVERPELSAQTIGVVDEIGAFADNLYILKRANAMVLKSYPAGAGFTYPEEYFSNAAFDQANDLLIDGNIYVISDTDPKMFKYFSGVEDSLQLSGLDKSLGNPTCGFTNLLDSSPLYVFDQTNVRVVVFEKGTAERHPGVAVMTNQYVYRGSRDDIFSDVREIVADPNEDELYVLDGTRILRVSLAHD